MARQALSPHMIARDQVARSSKDRTSDPSRTHAEAEFAAFSASSKRATDVKVKLPLLGNAPRQLGCDIVKVGVMLRGAGAPIGAESSWPHGVGTRPVSEPSTDALTSCNSMTCATNATAAAMLRSNSSYSGQPRTLPSISSSSDISAILGSHGRLKARHSVTPTSWMVGAQLHWSTATSGLLTFAFSAANRPDCGTFCFYYAEGHLSKIFACCRVLTNPYVVAAGIGHFS